MYSLQCFAHASSLPQPDQSLLYISVCFCSLKSFCVCFPSLQQWNNLSFDQRKWKWNRSFSHYTCALLHVTDQLWSTKTEEIIIFTFPLDLDSACYSKRFALRDAFMEHCRGTDTVASSLLFDILHNCFLLAPPAPRDLVCRCENNLRLQDTVTSSVMWLEQRVKSFSSCYKRKRFHSHRRTQWLWQTNSAIREESWHWM